MSLCNAVYVILYLSWRCPSNYTWYLLKQWNLPHLFHFPFFSSSSCLLLEKVGWKQIVCALTAALLHENRAPLVSRAYFSSLWNEALLFCSLLIGWPHASWLLALRLKLLLSHSGHSSSNLAIMCGHAHRKQSPLFLLSQGTTLILWVPLIVMSVVELVLSGRCCAASISFIRRKTRIHCETSSVCNTKDLSNHIFHSICLSELHLHGIKESTVLVNFILYIGSKLKRRTYKANPYT